MSRSLIDPPAVDGGESPEEVVVIGGPRYAALAAPPNAGMTSVAGAGPAVLHRARLVHEAPRVRVGPERELEHTEPRHADGAVRDRRGERVHVLAAGARDDLADPVRIR